MTSSSEGGAFLPVPAPRDPASGEYVPVPVSTPVGAEAAARGIDGRLAAGPMEYTGPQQPESPERGIVDRTKDAALDIGAVAAVGADAPFVFESLWLTATAAASEVHNPVVAAALVTAGTIALDVSAGFGAARLMARETGKRVMGAVHKGLGKLGLKDQVQTSLPTDVAIDFVAGAPIVAARKQALDPTRTEAQNRSYTTKTALIAGALAGPVNLAVAEGVHNINPTTAGVAAVAVAGFFAARTKVAGRLKARSERLVQAAKDQEIIATVPQEAAYDLTEEQCAALERDLVDQVAKTHGHTVAAVWIESGHPAANLMRTREIQALPDDNVPLLFKDYEDSSMFLAMVDTRDGARKGKVIRGTRVTGRRFSEDAQTDTSNIARDGGSEMAMIRDMVMDGEINGWEINGFYRASGIDLTKSISIETNYKIERAKPRFGIVKMADLAYLAMYHYAFGDRNNDGAAVFAHINDATAHSMGRLGLTIEPVAGREDLQTPASPGSEQRYDAKYRPVVMPNKGRTRLVLGAAVAYAPPQLFLTAPARETAAVDERPLVGASAA